MAIGLSPRPAEGGGNGPDEAGVSPLARRGEALPPPLELGLSPRPAGGGGGELGLSPRPAGGGGGKPSRGGPAGGGSHTLR